MNNRFVLKALLLACTASFGQSAEDRTITVNSARPVLAVLNQLRQQYGWAVSYEDPAIVYAGDLRLREIPPQDPMRLPMHDIVPKALPLSVDYHVDGSGVPEDRVAVMEKIAEAYEKATGLKFRVDRQGARLSMVPVSAHDRAGRLASAQTPLDALISIPKGKYQNRVLFDMISRAVEAATGTKIRWGVGPAFQGEQEFSAENERARDVLGRDLDGYSPKMPVIWTLNCDPTDGTFYFSFLPFPDPARMQLVRRP